MKIKGDSEPYVFASSTISTFNDFLRHPTPYTLRVGQVCPYSILRL